MNPLKTRTVTTITIITTISHTTSSSSSSSSQQDGVVGVLLLSQASLNITALPAVSEPGDAALDPCGVEALLKCCRRSEMAGVSVNRVKYQ